MLELVQNYTMSEILAFLITFALAIKGLVTFYDWSVERLKRIFKKETDQENIIDTIQRRLNCFDEALKQLSDEQKQTNEVISDLTNKMNMLVESDMDDIKSFITKVMMLFRYKQKWVDDYSLNCIERRFKHYINEGGNSFIADLMEEIRDLPKRPPQG